MLTTVPFAGFYNSIHDSELDDTLDRIFSDKASGCDLDPHGLRSRAFDAMPWGDVHREYAEKFCEHFAHKTGIALTWESMTSPREYNFSTDRIFATIEPAEVLRLLRELPSGELAEEAAERFTSRSGFISSYSADVDSWGPVETWDHNQVGTIVAAYVQHKFADEMGRDGSDWLDYEIVATMSENGEVEMLMFEAQDGAFARLANIHDYLEKRAER